MVREITFEHPVDPSQFGPEQIRPRALLALAMSGLSRWFATCLVPYSRLLSEHHTGLVFTHASLRRAAPDLRFRDADWLGVTARVSMSDSAKYLHLAVEFGARRDAGTGGHRPVASFDADLRVVSIEEGHALTALPGMLPDHLLALFEPTEIYEPDRAALTAVSMPPTGAEVLAAGFEVPLVRSDCEVADQWSFIEVAELATRARERLRHLDTTPETIARIARIAAAGPVARLDAVFDASLYVFDVCSVATRVLVQKSGDVVFLHTFTDAAHNRRCATVWELIAPGPRSLPDITISDGGTAARPARATRHP